MVGGLIEQFSIWILSIVYQEAPEAASSQVGFSEEIPIGIFSKKKE